MAGHSQACRIPSVILVSVVAWTCRVSITPRWANVAGLDLNDHCSMELVAKA